SAATAYNFVLQANAAASGELGMNGKAMFRDMLGGAMAVNPFLFDMLESIGLITGTPHDFEINWTNQEGVMSEIEVLTVRIEDLIRALGGSLTPLNIEVNGEEEVVSATEAIQSLAENAAQNALLKIKTQLEPVESDGTG